MAINESSDDATTAGVTATNTAGGDGVLSTGHRGVVGKSSDEGGTGVFGFVTAVNASGVFGESAQFHGVFGRSQGIHNAGVFGDNRAAKGGFGVIGVAEHGDGIGISGESKGDVGIGVLGRSVSPNGLAGRFEGNVRVIGDFHVTGDVVIPGADYAEAMTTSDPSVEAGLVVVLGDDGEVHLCDRDYDTAVAGIVSGAGGVKPALVLDRHENGAAVALMGKVWCMADADSAPIRPGNLLTTSSTAGHCRRVTEPARAFGAVIGKALTPLEAGRGLVRVLVSPR